MAIKRSNAGQTTGKGISHYRKNPDDASYMYTPEEIRRRLDDFRSDYSSDYERDPNMLRSVGTNTTLQDYYDTREQGLRRYLETAKSTAHEYDYYGEQTLRRSIGRALTELDSYPEWNDRFSPEPLPTSQREEEDPRLMERVRNWISERRGSIDMPDWIENMGKVSSSYMERDLANEAIVRDRVQNRGERQALLQAVEQRRNDDWFAEQEAKYGEIASRPDFEENSAGWEDFGRDFVRDTDLYTSIRNTVERRGAAEVMTDEQKRIYQYLLNTEGQDAANDYYDYISYDINEQAAQNLDAIAENQTNTFWGATGASIASVAANLAGGIAGTVDIAGQNLRNQFGEYRPIDYNSPMQVGGNYAQAVRENTMEDMGGVGRFLYSTGMSMADSVASIAIGGQYGGVLLGFSAAQSAVQDAHERGATDTQALASGIFAGAAEMIFERIGIDNLFKIAEQGMTDSARNIIKNIVSQMLAEGGEEVGTTISNTITDAIIMADKSELNTAIAQYEAQGMNHEDAVRQAWLDWAKNLALDFFGGAVSGGVMGSGGLAVGTYNTGRAVQQSGQAQDVVDYASQFGSDAAKALAQRAGTGDNASAIQLGRMFSNIENPVTDAYGGVDVRATIDRRIAQLEQETAQREAAAQARLTQPAAAPEAAQGASMRAAEEVVEQAAKPAQAAGKAENTAQKTAAKTRAMTVQDAKGNSVELVDVTTGQDENLAFVTADGREISEDDLNFQGSPKASQIAKYAGRMNEDGARGLVTNYDGGDVMPYVRSYDLAYREGMANEDMQSVRQRVSNLSDEAFQAAYRAGQIERTMNADTADVRGGVIRSYTKQPAENQARSIEVLDAMFRAIGRTVEIVDRIDITDNNGNVIRKSGSNAQFDEATNRYKIALDAQDEALMNVAVHETIHDIEKNAKAEFDALRDLVFKWLEMNGDNIETLRQRQRALMDGQSDAYYDAEIVANTVPRIFSNRGTFEQFVEKFMKDQSESEQRAFMRMVERVLEFIKDALRKLSEYSSWAQVKQLKAQHDMLQAVRDQYFEALDVATRQDAQGEGDTRNSFARELNTSAVDAAEQMRFEGASAQDIFNETGLVRDASGIWVYEIDDSEMKIYPRGDAKHADDPQYQRYVQLARDGDFFSEEYQQLDQQFNMRNRVRTLADYVKHDALFERYPRLQDARFEFKKLGEGENASYSPRTDTITVSERFKRAIYENDLPSTLIHEIQHMIQRMDNRAGGSSIEYWQYRGASEQEARDLYRNTAGEIEARETSRRQRMTAQERAEQMPDLGEDRAVFAEDAAFDYDAEIAHIKDQLRASQDELNAMSPVFTLSDVPDVGKGKREQRRWIVDVLRRTGFAVDREGFGRIEFNEKQLDAGLRYVKSQEEAIAYSSIPHVLKRGIEIHDHSDHKGREFGTTTIAAPVEIGGVRGNVGIVVKKTKGNVFKALRILMPNGTLFVLDKNTEASSGLTGALSQRWDTHAAPTEDASKNRIANPIGSVNPNLRYSAKDVDVEALQAENAQLRAANAELAAQMRRTQGVNLDERAIRRFTRKLVKREGSTFDADQLANSLSRLYDSMANADDMTDEDAARIIQSGTSLARQVLAQARYFDQDGYDADSSVREFLRDTAVELPAEYDDAIRRMATNRTAYRTQTRGVLNIVGKGKGVSIDQLWQSGQEQFPNVFSENVTNPEDMVEELFVIAQGLKADAYFGDNPYANDLDTASNILFLEMQAELMNIPRVKTLADKAAEAAKAQRRVDRAEKAAARSERRREKAEERYEKRREADKERAQRQVEHVREVERTRYDRHDESITRQKYRDRINRRSNELYQWLAKPNDRKHVPASMTAAVVNVLRALDFERRAPQQTKAAPGTKTYAAWAARQQAYENGGSETNRSRLWAQRMQKLSEVLTTAEGSKDEALSAFGLLLDPDLADDIKAFAENNSDVPISSMNSTQLRELSQLMGRVKKAVTETNKMHGQNRGKQVSEVVEQTAKDFRVRRSMANSPIGKLLRSRLYLRQMDAGSFFHMLGDGATTIYNGLRSGFDKFITNVDEAIKVSQAVLKNVDVKRLNNIKQGIEIETADGKIMLTRAQVMSLYCLDKRDAGRQHLYGEGGGIVSVRDNVQEAHAVTETQVKAATSKLTDEERKAADALQQFMSTRCTEWGNEATMEMYGYRKFGEEFYFPIKSVRTSFNESDQQQVGDTAALTAIKNRGFTKALKENATNPVVIDDILSVYSAHVADMAEYNAYLAPLADAMRWYNWRGTVQEGVAINLHQEWLRAFPDTVHIIGEKKGKTSGNPVEEYFLDFIRRLNGGGTRSAETLPMVRFAKSAAVGLNLSVAIQQGASYSKAVSMIDRKWLWRGLPSRKNARLAEQYAPIAKWKSWGFFQSATGKNVESLLNGDTSLLRKARDKQGFLAEFGDRVTWARLWGACAAEQRAQDPNRDAAYYKSEEFYQKVGARLSQIIDGTQVVDSVFHRSPVTENKVLSIVTAFMSETMKSYSMLAEAEYNYRANKTKVNREHLNRTKRGLVASQLAAAVLQAFVGAWRDKDKEKGDDWAEKALIKMRLLKPVGKYTYGQKLMVRALENAAGNMNPLNLHWLTAKLSDEIFSALSDWTPSSTLDTKVIESFGKLFKELKKDEEADAQKILWYTVEFVSYMTGIGVQNVYRDLIETPIRKIMETKTGFIPGMDEVFYFGGEGESIDGSMDAVLAAETAEVQQKNPSYSADKAEREARGNLRGEITSEYKEVYAQAFAEGDTETMTEIKRFMADTGLYIDGTEPADACERWLRDYFKTQYLEATTDEERKEARRLLMRSGYYDSPRELNEAIEGWTQ